MLYSKASGLQTICLLMTERRGPNYIKCHRGRPNGCQKTILIAFDHHPGLLKGECRFLVQVINFHTISFLNSKGALLRHSLLNCIFYKVHLFKNSKNYINIRIIWHMERQPRWHHSKKDTLETGEQKYQTFHRQATPKRGARYS